MTKKYKTDKKLSREKVFRDPVLDYIYVNHQVIIDLINTKEFQRLRRIKQLGTSSQTFHGAEHSRFAHSLGVYEIARRICDNFSRNYPHKNKDDGLWDDQERLVTLCAALLHDIGHGPYSHTFEHIFGTKHEEITTKIITSPKSEINHVLKNISPSFPDKVAAVISKTYPNSQVVQIISSQLDADRMDYLLRDSYHTGANYGNFDLNRILRVMKPYKDGIGFEISGMHAVEDYIVSRLQMYVQVYFHPVSRSMEIVLKNMFQRATYLYNKSFKDAQQIDPLNILNNFFNKKFNLNKYLQLDDGVINTYFILWSQSSDNILADLADRFINRKPFKSAKYTDNNLNVIPKLKKIIKNSGYNPNYYSATDNSFDQPYDAYNPKSSPTNTQIELIQKDGSLTELSTVSPIVRVLTGKEIGDKRFFFPKEMFSKSNPQNFNNYIKNDYLVDN